MSEQGQLGMGGEVHSKAVAEQTGVRKGLRVGTNWSGHLKIKETAALAPAPVSLWMTDLCIPFIS